MKKIALLLLMTFTLESVAVAIESSPKSGGQTSIFGKKKRYKPKKQRRGGFLGLFGKRNGCNCPKH